ncbi:hypothetical protein GGR54DRAFT_636475 [Hypoxylon sp. NC1633]|nr:hypothetical protein GGR54DRAFT_636475 [Hypoxylon sp. NC1633]
MKLFGLYGALVTAVLLPATQANWCQLYDDGRCMNSDNGVTNFDCANHNIFGSGGGFIKCHRTTGNSRIYLLSNYIVTRSASLSYGTSLATNSFAYVYERV